MPMSPLVSVVKRKWMKSLKDFKMMAMKLYPSQELPVMAIMKALLLPLNII